MSWEPFQSAMNLCLLLKKKNAVISNLFQNQKNLNMYSFTTCQALFQVFRNNRLLFLTCLRCRSYPMAILQMERQRQKVEWQSWALSMAGWAFFLTLKKISYFFSKSKSSPLPHLSSVPQWIVCTSGYNFKIFLSVFLPTLLYTLLMMLFT